MGIYRTLLEEEVPHLDDNNNPDEQIQELMDIVDDTDANEAEQERAQEAEFAEPGTQADELLDESWMAIYEFEEGNARLMRAIGIHELTEAAAGRDVLWEAPDIKGFFHDVKEKIVAFFKKVWSVIQRWAGNLAAVFTTNKKFAEKYASQIREGHKLFTADKTAKDIKGYQFTGLNPAEDNVDRTAASATRKVTEALDDKENTSFDSADSLESFVNKVRGEFCNESSVSASEFNKKLKEYLYGSDSADTYVMPPDLVISVLTDKKDDMNKVKKISKEARTQMKKTLDSLKKLEANAGKAKKNETSEATKNRLSDQAVLTRKVSAARQILSANQIWRSAMYGAIRARAAQARRYGMAYVAAYNRNRHKGFQKESTEYGFLSHLNLV